MCLAMWAWVGHVGVILQRMDKRTKRIYYCGHCNEKVSKTLYFQHKRLYYSSRTHKWKRDEVPSCSKSSFSFSDTENEAESSDHECDPGLAGKIS